MKGPGLLTMLMFLALAVYAYAEAAPRAHKHDLASFFGRPPARAACPLGTHYSSFTHTCAHTWATAAPR